jgi:hypothetical protein
MLAPRYATVMNVVFCCLVYGPGMPVFYVIAVITFVFMYVFEKYSFLRVYALPPHYDDQLQDEFISYLPWAIFLHACFAFVFFTSDVTDSYYIDDYLANYTNVTLSNTFDFGEETEDRLNQVNGLPSLVIIIAFIAFKMVQLILAICPCSCGQDAHKKISQKVLAAYSEMDDYWMARRKVHMESYHLHQVPKFVRAYFPVAGGAVLEMQNELLDDPYADDEDVPPVFKGVFELFKAEHELEFEDRSSDVAVSRKRTPTKKRKKRG